MESAVNKLIFGEIDEGGSKLIFNPPLEVKYWILSEKDKSADIWFDFGLQIDLRYDNYITSEYKTVVEKIKKMIEFELFHAFMHYNGDPNYTVIHWALFGNLFYRVKCIEDYGENNKEVWTFQIEDGKLCKINEI
jgi:hypothetical protein